MSKKFFLAFIIFFAILNTVSAFDFNVENFKFRNLFQSFFNKIQNSSTTTVKIEKRKFFKPEISLESFSATGSNTRIGSSSSSEYKTIEEYDLDKLLESEKRQKSIFDKITKLTINTKLNPTVEETCNFGNSLDKEKCKKDLFIGCGDSLYLGLEMTPECKQFNTKDYDKYLDLKKRQDENPFLDTEKFEFSVGEISLEKNSFNSQKAKELENSINSGEINTDIDIEPIEKIREERKIIEPVKEITFKTVSKPTAPPILSSFSSWVTGWATVFAVNGGRSEAGFRMNQLTAFGYNPYHPKTCVVSLPYKTIDKFFSTTLNKCVKQSNVKCISNIKEKIKDELIEIVMMKNGKRATFPIGDFGPAEWTGNAIDLTPCTKKILGATGKDLVMFRPVR